MPSLNVYVPDELHKLTAKWRGTLNYSEICARALREELEAVESGRVVGQLFKSLRQRSKAESAMTRRMS
jgi:hypothetical protein